MFSGRRPSPFNKRNERCEMSNREDWVVIIVGVLTVIFICSGILYKCVATDVDCWFSNDPIICQKLKDSVK